MNTLKLLLFTAFIAFCCVLGVQSLHCYSCKNTSACENPQKYLCNQTLANETQIYLSLNYKGVTFNHTSNSFQCLSDYFNTSMANHMYKGCIYSTTKACKLVPNESINLPQRICSQCSKDYCNPAARAYFNPWNSLTAIAVIILTKFTML